MQGGCLAPAPAPGSPGQSVLLAPGSALMDSAIHHFIIRKDFHAAFEACEKGLEIVSKTEEQEPNCVSVRPKALQERVEEIKAFSVKKIFHSDLIGVYMELAVPRHGELKASLCIVGIQALAELNQWRDVLTWVLQHYGESEQIPAKIMQMCILLYTKVEEQVEVREATQSWLHHSSNRGLPGYSSVAELYVLHVLLPLGQTSEAKELLRDDVGQLAFTKDQRQTALSILEDHEAKTTDQSHPTPKNVPAEEEKTTEGSVARRLNAVLRLLYRGLSSAGATAWSRIIRRTAVLLVLLYLLLVRMDPALPSAYVWILRLYGLWQQMWNAMFGPYYRASS